MLNPRASATLYPIVPASSPAEFAQLRPGLWTWHTYDSSVKAELFSAALALDRHVYIVDPIPLPAGEIAILSQAGSIAAVIVTNANHERAALDYSDTFSAPIVAHSDVLKAVRPARPGDLFAITSQTGFEAIEIEGAVAGEIALYHPLNGGTLIIGDALINFEPYGFSFLPRKYCLDQKQMCCSLGKLLALPVERMLFAHGTPILSGAGDRLRELLRTDP